MGMYVTRLGDNINAYKDLLGNLRETDNFEDLSIGGDNKTWLLHM
jgi:hypothetical protein